MDNYVDRLKNDLLEQFKDKPRIEQLIEVLGIELQEVAVFFEELFTHRSLGEACGDQLDGAGSIVGMSRVEATQWIGEENINGFLDDETYRKYLIFKSLKNASNCTYQEIVSVLKMFWDGPLYYREDPSEPATMIFETEDLDGTSDTRSLFAMPQIRAAGVAMKLIAKASTKMPTIGLNVASDLGFSATETVLPML